MQEKTHRQTQEKAQTNTVHTSRHEQPLHTVTHYIHPNKQKNTQTHTNTKTHKNTEKNTEKTQKNTDKNTKTEKHTNVAAAHTNTVHPDMFMNTQTESTLTDTDKHTIGHTQTHINIMIKYDRTEKFDFNCPYNLPF